ncbi:hypothetical protein PF005_g20992 [Phytophthora fragariae]|uniref:CCHC-type domain-containing protein n=1 Tax=Phytophthora fragariae TaxID=53985 RepID=A0A6A3IVG7_9STRA|nr:hypothetical protein PF003_g33567 [Phytophthora fragariae]KAE8927806.1 hypothetical protein PF009_g22034 [Phytophthora fragariae]KAE8987026.1 hypothetical protein PF011_g19741 [Phytophthora fragariae]KAE9085532.1 hypothetical protein PF010_g20424 [Phytophthora fragariae]KAE9085554.1 hypothetical protein PF007_g21100 [Phytophthora fragariae]
MNNESSKTEGLPDGWDGKDWRRYKWTMRTIFREHDLLDIAEGKIKREGLSSEESEANFDKKQFKVMRMIGTTIPSHRLQQIDQYETGTEMWAALCEIYEKRQNATIRVSTILRLSEELKSLKCSSNEDVQSHVTKMFRLKTDLASYGYEVNNINMKAMLLDSLPDQYEFEQLRGAVKYGGNGGALTPEELRVLIEEAADRQARRRGGGGRRNNNGGPRQAGGLGGGSSQPGRSNNGGRGNGGGGHGAKGTGARSSSRGCFVCGETSHYKANCPNQTADQADRAGAGPRLDGHRQNRSNYARGAAGDRVWSPRQEPGTVATALEEAHLATALDEAHLTSSYTPGVGDNAGVAMEIPSGSSWFCFDTGSNVHIVGDRHSFVHLEDIVPENLAADVKGVAQSMVTQAEGIGTVKIVSIVQDKEVELFIDGVLYVPGATHGLLSMGLALEQGFEVDYDRATRVYSVHKDGEHVIEARPAQAIWVFRDCTGIPEKQQARRSARRHGHCELHGCGWGRKPPGVARALGAHVRSIPESYG